jgi:hypothetical protein
MQCRSCAIASGTVDPRSSAAVGGRGAPCGPGELRHRVDLWAVLAEGPDNRRRNPTEALDLGGDRRGSGFWEEGGIELSS